MTNRASCKELFCWLQDLHTDGEYPLKPKAVYIDHVRPNLWFTFYITPQEAYYGHAKPLKSKLQFLIKRDHKELGSYKLNLAFDTR